MDRAYFERYCRAGSYDENYLYHSGIEHSIEICDRFDLPIKSVLVLGAATGRVLEHQRTVVRSAAWHTRASRPAIGGASRAPTCGATSLR